MIRQNEKSVMRGQPVITDYFSLCAEEISAYQKLSAVFGGMFVGFWVADVWGKAAAALAEGRLSLRNSTALGVDNRPVRTH
jgi:hypothetical protein